MTEPQESESVLPELASWKPDFLPDDLAPPLDRERLKALVRRQLPKRSVRTLFELTMRFRCWQQAYQEVLVAECQNSDMTDDSLEESETLDSTSVDGPSLPSIQRAGKQVSQLPLSMALGAESLSDSNELTFTISPEQCEWIPARPESLADSEGRIAVRSMASGALSVTIGGFLFDSDEYQVEAVLFAADKGELARAKPENPQEPTLVLMPKEHQHGAASANELQIRSSYKPESGQYWMAIVRLKLD